MKRSKAVSKMSEKPPTSYLLLHNQMIRVGPTVNNACLSMDDNHINLMSNAHANKNKQIQIILTWAFDALLGYATLGHRPSSPVLGPGLQMIIGVKLPLRLTVFMLMIKNLYSAMWRSQATFYGTLGVIFSKVCHEIQLVRGKKVRTEACVNICTCTMRRDRERYNVNDFKTLVIVLKIFTTIEFRLKFYVSNPNFSNTKPDFELHSSDNNRLETKCLSDFKKKTIQNFALSVMSIQSFISTYHKNQNSVINNTKK
ncbi:hypothetical protein OSB04_012241 [Centaurea solstitialis]|uniref:Uncharacterized protein n=1 Tax=Centaurea solstitialis TaxID=347529 RepID=A0AA38WEF3_9ASTR|nr:hypothetical protein OSB04_012241 [Centaurea solstitialis]